MTIFFTADTHFGHTNIIKYCQRPWSTNKEHDAALIDNWNQVVKPEDFVYHLGDFGLASPTYLYSILRSLNGRKYFIRGNHDKSFKRECLTEILMDTKYHELTIQDKEAPGGKRLITLCHYPFETWNKSHYGSWSLHGHCHGGLPTPKGMLRLDVGVDGNSYFPVSYEEIKQYMEEQLK